MADHYLDTIRLATMIQSNIRACMKGGVINAANCPNVSDLVADFVVKVEQRVNDAHRKENRLLQA